MSFISLLLWTQLEIITVSVTCSPSLCEAAFPQNRQCCIICSQDLCCQMSCDRHLPGDFIPQPQDEERAITNSVTVPAAASISSNTLYVSHTSLAKTLKDQPRLLPLHLCHHTAAFWSGEAFLNCKISALALVQLSL